MRKLSPLLLFILTLHCSFTEVSKVDCTIEIESSTFIIDGATFNPGDVICLMAGNKDYLLFKNIQGTSELPITIINQGGAVIINTEHFYGIKFDSCKHVIFSGGGEPGIQYGIQVQRVAQGAGLSIDKLSTNIEIEFVEISFTSIGGIYAKTEPYQGDCNDLITRDNFTMYNLKIHDCYLHDITDEGMYIGSSKYTGQTIYECNDTVVLPHVIEGVEVYNNIVENTGWDAIQVSSSPVNCNIYGNIIRNDSYAEEYGQMSGILIGGGSKCDCYNNKIFDGKGDGIDVFGLGNMKIYNNLIVRAGRTYEPGDPSKFKHGIYVGEIVTTPDANFKLYNNTIVSPKSNGIKYTNNVAAMGYIINNLITDPGVLTNEGDPFYINIEVDTQYVEVTRNFEVADNTIVKFSDFFGNNFDLKPNSEAVNYGISLLDDGISFDIDYRSRPFHIYFDAGAYECHDPNADIIEVSDDIGIPYPIPAKDHISIPVNPKINEDFILRIISLNGKVVFEETFMKNQSKSGKITIAIDNIKSGNYIINTTTKNNSISRPIIIVN